MTAALQQLINDSTDLGMSRSRVVGSSITRSGRIVTSSAPTAQPYQFTISYAPGYRFNTLRGFVEQLMFLDRAYAEDVDIGRTNTGLAWLTEYQGDLTPAQLNNITIAQVNDDNVMRITLPAGVSGVAFRAGDLIQPDSGGYSYPYSVVYDVPAIAGDVDVILHRPFLEQLDVTNTAIDVVGGGLKVGVDVTWRVRMSTTPEILINSDRFLNLSSVTLVEVIK